MILNGHNVYLIAGNQKSKSNARLTLGSVHSTDLLVRIAIFNFNSRLNIRPT